MKTTGIIGGMSWESTVLYYQLINRGIKRELGGLHSARLLINSVDFAEIEALQHAGNWDAAGSILNAAARSLQRGGADQLLIATNTMHKVVDQVMQSIDLPLLHIVDPTADAIKAQGFRTIGLLGTGFTMSDSFYKGRMEQQHGLSVIVPDEGDQAIVHRIIYEELCLGEINEASLAAYLAVIDKLAAAGAQAVILGCTEITLLVKQHHTELPLLDTTALHAEAAVQSAIAID